MEAIPEKKQKNPGLALLEETFARMQKDVAENHTLSDTYLPELEKALYLSAKSAVEFVILNLGEAEVIQPQDMPTQEDIDAYMEEAIGKTTRGTALVN